MSYIKLLGAGREVGRSAILVEHKGRRVLLDYGVQLTDGKPEYPLHVSPKQLDLIALSHAHLDHSGALPLLYTAIRPLLAMNRMTARLTELLIMDFLRLSKYYLPYEVIELENVLNSYKDVRFGRVYQLGGVEVEFKNAGHVPGSAMIKVRIEDLEVLYTGDFNTIETRLLRGADVKNVEADVVIMEGTYAGVNHPNRVDEEKRFIETINEVVGRGGTVLIPAFSVGRSQEVLCILEHYKVGYRVILDGMARRVTQMLLEEGGYVRDISLLSRAARRAQWISRDKERRKVVKRGECIIVSPSGMLKGGPSVKYMKKLGKDPKNAILLVSYQLPGTPGRVLLDTGKFVFDGEPEEVEARVEYFEFSSHCGHKELVEFAKQLKNANKLLIVHTEGDAVEKLREEIYQETGIETVAPRNGDIVEI